MVCVYVCVCMVGFTPRNKSGTFINPEVIFLFKRRDQNESQIWRKLEHFVCEDIFFLPLSKTDRVRKIICIQGLNTRITYYLGSYMRTWKSFTCHLPFTFPTKKMLIVHLMFFFPTKILPENLDSVFSVLLVNVYQNKHSVSFDYSLF